MFEYMKLRNKLDKTVKDRTREFMKNTTKNIRKLDNLIKQKINRRRPQLDKK